MIIIFIGLFVSMVFLLYYMAIVGTMFGGFIILILTMILQITFISLDYHLIESRSNSEDKR